MVKITIIGTGYVGLVTGTCLAEIGHRVICVDIDKNKINKLNQDEIPIYEPGLKELVIKNKKENRLFFTIDIDNSIKESDVIFSAVGTPMGENHKADLKYIKEVAKSFAKNLNSYKILVTKSTVPVGTADMVKEIITDIIKKENKEIDFDIVSNPEFLKEGAAIKDFLNPDRIVIGVDSQKAKNILKEIYSPLERIQSPIIFTDIKSAELIKYAANSMLATRISFINEIARYCDLIGANVKEVAKGIGLDSRIGPRFLQAGIGYGGSCFPKDVAALIESGKEVNYDFKILNSVIKVNDEQKKLVLNIIKDKFGNNLENKTFSILGVAFKPKTDDIREAPSIEIIKEIIILGGNINIFDPIAAKNLKKEYPKLSEKINFFNNYYDALKNSDSLILVTEWDEFRSIDFKKVKKLMKGNLIIDGRNIFNPIKIKENGFDYVGIGRN